MESRVYEEAKDKTKARVTREPRVSLESSQSAELVTFWRWQVQKVLEDANDEYNLSHTAQMNLVFFQDHSSYLGE